MVTRALTAGMFALVLAIASGCALTVSNQPDAAASPPETVSCAALAENLRACRPAICSQPHPFAPSFTIEHRVSGLEDGACAYSQTMPGDMRMECRFSEAGRAEMAATMEEFLSGGQMSFSFSTSDPTPQDAMTRECEVKDKDGAAIPWGG